MSCLMCTRTRSPQTTDMDKVKQLNEKTILEISPGDFDQARPKLHGLIDKNINQNTEKTEMYYPETENL